MGGKAVKRWVCGPATLYLGDCRDVMRAVPRRSVCAIVTDPPYGITDLPWDKACTDDSWWAAARRVLPDNGPVVMFCSGRFTIDLIASRRREVRHKWVWVRGKRVTGHLRASVAPLRRHEDVLVFCPRQPAYYRVRIGDRVSRAGARPAEDTGHWGRVNARSAITSRGHLPTDVQDFPAPSGAGRTHPTEKPVGLLDILCRAYSPRGHAVMDPFMGTGATGVAAVGAGRRFVGCEIEERFFTVARDRIYAAIREADRE